MANQIPLSGAANASGGYLLPPEQGEILTNGMLEDAGALALAGDKRSTSSRKTTFPIWLGDPDAAFTDEAGTKSVTGAELDTDDLNIKKIATIVVFTDEMLEDLASGDLNVLVDSGVRRAINRKADQHAVGIGVTSSFDSELSATTSQVALGTETDALRRAVSAAMGSLEANGYDTSGPDTLGVLLAADFRQHIRDARNPGGSANVLYDNTADPLYGATRAYSANLTGVGGTVGTDIVGLVVHRPNLHVRVRKDVTVTPSNEASLVIAGQTKSLYQEDLSAARYVTRLGFLVHDLNNAVVAIRRS